MRKYLLGALLLGLSQYGDAQDYVITWDNDTVACTFPAKPGKEGLRPARKYENGYLRVPAIFAGDSIRVLRAGEVKGYFRKAHGKYLLCNGFFESRKIVPGAGVYENEQDNQWYFMNRVLEGKYASLYMIYLPGRHSPQPVYLVAKHTDPDPLTAFTIWNTKSARRLLAEPDIKKAMEQYLSVKRRKFTEMVLEYNRLKGGISSVAP
jgi:hypothetical protein